MTTDVMHGPGAAAPPRRKTTSPGQDLARGVWRENPVLVQALGMCPILAVTNSVENSVAMGAATLFVLAGSSVLVASLRRLIPGEVRITSYILIIATFVTVVDYLLAATVPGIHKSLGAFIALIVVNCMILGRQEAFASRNSPWRALLDAVGTGTGFLVALIIMGSIREVLGNGSLLGFRVMPPGFEPWVVMILPAGGFFTMGCVLLALSWWTGRTTPKKRKWPHPVAERAGSPVGALR